VYDGLAPVLLPAVLERRRGAPIALALAAGAVARRVGLHVALVCVDDEQLPGLQQGAYKCTRPPSRIRGWSCTTLSPVLAAGRPSPPFNARY
jgi:Transglutaminase-like superfamily